MGKKFLMWMGAGAVAAIVLIVALVAISQNSAGGGDATNITGVAEVQKELKGIPVSDNVLGKKGAPVEVIEAVDPMCPACAAYSKDELGAFLDTYVRPGAVRMSRIMYPLPIHGSGAVEGSYGALAAGRQDRLWEYTEIFLRNQGTSDDYVTPEFLSAVAKAAGVDMGTWDADMANKDSLFGEKIFADKDLVESWKIDATPGFRIIGPRGERTVVGGDSAAIDAAIAAVR